VRGCGAYVLDRIPAGSLAFDSVDLRNSGGLMQPRKPSRTVAVPAPGVDEPVDAAAERAAADAEYEAFLVFQDIGAKNSKRALGGRRATRPR
jgi:hypothetical protein